MYIEISEVPARFERRTLPSRPTPQNDYLNVSADASPTLFSGLCTSCPNPHHNDSLFVAAQRLPWKTRVAVLRASAPTHQIRKFVFLRNYAASWKIRVVIFLLPYPHTGSAFLFRCACAALWKICAARVRASTPAHRMG